MSTKEKILGEAIVLFAQKGYSGLSMRQLAQATGVSVAAIYHHFPDKNTLYLEAIRYAFSDKAAAFEKVWMTDDSAPEKLRHFVRTLLEVMLKDQDGDFCRLMQREIMEADAERMQLLAQGVFKQQFCLLMDLAGDLAPDCDVYLAATAIIGLVQNTVEHRALHRHFPGWKPEHDDPDVIAAHITAVLLHGLTARDFEKNN